MNLAGADEFFFRWFNSLAGHGKMGDATIVFLSTYLAYFVVAGLLLFGGVILLSRFAYLRKRGFEMIIVAFGAALISRFIIGELIRFFYNRPRPFEVLSNIHQLVSHDAGRSFPSGHALFFYPLAVITTYYYPRMGIALYVAVIALTFARISAGIHWPSDVVAGAVIGIGCGLLLYRGVHYIRPL